MNKSLIAVIDGTKARLFTIKYPDFPEYQSGPDLIERECLTSTAKELQGKDLWSNTKTGSNHGSGTKGHNYDDHRDNHLQEFERNFAKEIAQHVIELMSKEDLRQLILVAEPQILGLLRNVLQVSFTKKNIEVEEIAKDLCKYKPQKIHEYLAELNLIPARKFVPAS